MITLVRFLHNLKIYYLFSLPLSLYLSLARHGGKCHRQIKNKQQLWSAIAYQQHQKMFYNSQGISAPQIIERNYLWSLTSRRNNLTVLHPQPARTLFKMIWTLSNHGSQGLSLSAIINKDPGSASSHSGHPLGGRERTKGTNMMKRQGEPVCSALQACQTEGEESRISEVHLVLLHILPLHSIMLTLMITSYIETSIHRFQAPQLKTPTKYCCNIIINDCTRGTVNDNCS